MKIGNRYWLALWAALLFAGSLWLFTRHNAFAFFDHPDEPHKVAQVFTRNWNFHHPMLLLRASELGAHVAGAEQSRQQIVIVGRWISALFAAIAVVALSLLAYRMRGWPAALAAGILLALNHQFFELAHYMKEDTALVMGFALTFLAMHIVSRKMAVSGILFLGLSAALAFSGKYLGIIALAFALPVLLCAEGSMKKRWRLAIFFTAFVIVTALINLPLIEHLSHFRESFDREVSLVVHGQHGVSRRVPTGVYTHTFAVNTDLIVWILLAFYFWKMWVRRRELTLCEWLLALFPVAFAIMLSFFPKTNDRYFLPATAGFLLLASLGFADAVRLWKPRILVPFGLSLMAICELSSGIEPGLIEYYSAFQHDDHRALREWIAANVPPNAIIAEDDHAGLPTAQSNKFDQPLLAQTVLCGNPFAADLGTLDELRQRGVHYVVVADTNFGHFFSKNTKSKKSQRDRFAKEKAFYEQLFQQGKLRWQPKVRRVIYLHPGLRVYEI